MTKLSKIFKKNKNIIIGAIHLPPLLSYPEFPGLKVATENAKKDLEAFTYGGADAVIYENNYDIPHQPFVNNSVAISMALAGEEIRKFSRIPMGVNTLWNDFYTSLSLAKLLNLKFIRIPVFVDKVKTDCGIISGEAKKVLDFRKNIGASDIALFTDIHVKHSKLLSRHSLVESAKLAIKGGSDAIIITGNWTGQAPNLDDLKKVRKAVGNFLILIGSGLNQDNAKGIFKIANGAIVSTSLKAGSNKKQEVNVKNYTQRIDKKRVRKLVETLGS